MKTILKIVGCIQYVFLCCVANAQCYEVSAPIADVCITRSGFVYAVAGGGTIRKSSDAGKSWELLDPKVTSDFLSVFFINDEVGFTCGESVVLKTGDGGKTWNTVLNSENAFLSIYFISETEGYTITELGKTFKTNDAGVTWVDMNFPNGLSASNYGYFNQVYFLNKQKGFVCQTSAISDGGELYRTTDGGASWEMIMQDGRYVCFTDELNGYAVKNSNTLCKTYNGGDSWTELNIGINDYITQLKFYGKVGYATCAGGSVLKTYDGGITWIFQKSNVSHTLNGVASDKSGSLAFVVGTNATILKTENGGAKWNILSLGPPSDANCKAGCFVDETTAYVLTTKEYLMKTTNAGVTWKPIAIDPNALFKDIVFVNPNVGYIASTGGSIWKTTDAGSSWQKMTAPVDIYKFYALNENELFAFGYGFYKSKNGGLTWNSVANTKNILNGTGARTLNFINDSLGFLLTENGMYTTFNRGDSWHPGQQSVCGICPGGALITHYKHNLFVAGTYLYKSTDNGKTWEKVDYRKVQTGSYYEPPVDIYFNDDENGYLLPGYGDFLKTVDGGNNFNKESLREGSFSLQGLAFSGTYGLAFGSNGRIYRPYKMAGKFVGAPEFLPSPKNRLLVYPNPASKLLTINCAACSSDALIEIFDSAGKIVFSQLKETQTEESIDISFLPSGCYGIKVGKHFARFIRE